MTGSRRRLMAGSGSSLCSRTTTGTIPNWRTTGLQKKLARRRAEGRQIDRRALTGCGERGLISRMSGSRHITGHAGKVSSRIAQE